MALSHDERAKPYTRPTLITPPRRWLNLDLGELWRYRELVYFFVWRDLKVRYKQTLIGASWAVLQPVLIMVVFTVFFGQLLGLPSGGAPAPLFYYSALLPWTYFANAVSTSAGSIVQNQTVVTKTYFPRLVLPLSGVLPALVDFAIAFGVLVLMLIFYGIVPTAAFLLLPVFLLLAVLTALAVGLWLSAINALYRDVRHVLPFVIQIWFFASPVIYSADTLPSWARSIYGLNPMVGVIEGFRWAIIGHGQAPGKLILISAAMVLVTLCGGLVYFGKKETVIADVV